MTIQLDPIRQLDVKTWVCATRWSWIITPRSCTKINSWLSYPHDTLMNTINRLIYMAYPWTRKTEVPSSWQEEARAIVLYSIEYSEGSEGIIMQNKFQNFQSKFQSTVQGLNNNISDGASRCVWCNDHGVVHVESASCSCLCLCSRVLRLLFGWNMYIA